MAKILIADDNVEWLETQRAVLQHLGHQVVIASSRDQGLREAAKAAFSLVVADIFLPEMGGFELIEALRTQTPDLRVIVLTGSGVMSSTTAMAITHKLGPVTTLSKPVSPRQLLGAVQGVLAAAPAPADALIKATSAQARPRMTSAA